MSSEGYGNGICGVWECHLRGMGMSSEGFGNDMRGMGMVSEGYGNGI